MKELQKFARGLKLDCIASNVLSSPEDGVKQAMYGSCKIYVNQSKGIGVI
jgi:hypothetical protein